MHPVILSDGSIINGNKLFGKELDKALTICKSIYDRHMYPFEHGYPKNPALSIGNVRPYNCPEGKKWSECINEWMNNHPTEKAQYDNAKANWNNETARLYKTLYGIAKRKHIRIEWLGERSSCCFPDQFLVYKNGNRIAMIQC